MTTQMQARPMVRISSSWIQRTVLAGAAMLLSMQVWGAGTLTIDDGVVVKFGSQSQLVVRDRLVPGKNVTLTSQKDDSVGEAVGTTPQTPAAGDWRGMRIEKSAASSGAISLNGWSLRYAGSGSGAAKPGPALTLRGWSPGLQFMNLSDSDVGLHLLDGAQPAITGSSFLRNGSGLVATESSGASVTGSQFVGNRDWGVNNQTPSVVLNARGNWWGHASGAKQTQTQPQGQGDAVSSGVDYGAALAVAPLLNPRLEWVNAARYVAGREVQLDVFCVNATEYRVAESAAFAGVAFQPLSAGRARAALTLSEADGLKSVDLQCRDAAGTVASARLAQGVRVDLLAPQVAISSPAAGSVIAQSLDIEASASDGNGIASVAFYVDGVLKASDTTSPYRYAWSIDSESDGSHSLRVVATDGVGRTQEQSHSVTLSRVPLAPDTEGPQISDMKVGASALADALVISGNATLTLKAQDRSGVARVELLLDGTVKASAGGSGALSLALNIDEVTDGSHVLSVRAMDSLNNVTQHSFTVSVAHAAPPAPVITQPSQGSVTRDASVTVSGTAVAGSSVQILRSAEAVGAAVVAGSNGRFATSVDLVSGANVLQARATTAHGQSELSAAVTITRDTSVPGGPSHLVALSQAAGQIKLSWTPSTDAHVVGYHVYRSPASFSLIGEATRVSASPITGNSYEDMPADGSWVYRVVSVNAAATASEPSNEARATADSQAPAAVSITYTTSGKTDPVTGAFGQGRVSVKLVVSEPLLSSPYLSIVPQGGSPLSVSLTQSAETVFEGSFLISGNTPSGVADAIFSARDAVGNRGTAVRAGATLKIDTQGPVLSGITLSPAAPIRYDGATPVEATLSFSKPTAALPQVRYLLSGSGRSTVDLNLTRIDDSTYSTRFTMPSDAGQSAPETLSFRHTARDALDNLSSQVAAFNQFQVYQGDLPPLDVPVGLSAKPQPAGKVRLSWLAVEGAHSYEIYRLDPGHGEFEVLVRHGATEYIDTTPADGTYQYAVASVRQVNGQESLSGRSAAVSVSTLASAPGAPQNLTLSLTGQGIYAAWVAPLGSAVDHYRLYRATGTSITSVQGLSPLKDRIKLTQTYDTSPSPTQGAYVVTAVDAAGNESAISNSAYLNASLLPVRSLKVEQIGNQLPVLGWSAPNGAVAGYKVYIGAEGSQQLMTAQPISGTRFEDSGYTSGSRRYSVASVDANGVEMPSSVELPYVNSMVASGLPLSRGVMNRVQVQVTNLGATSLSGVQAQVRVPLNAQGTQYKDHRSEAFVLGPNETRLVPVVVGGYAELADSIDLQVGLDMAPEDGPRVTLLRNQRAQVNAGGLVVGMSTQTFTRGATGQVRLTIENTSEVDVELLTATANGAKPSSELRFKILDADGNVLSTQGYQQALGANVVTLTNGLTVARIAAGSSYVSDVFDVNVPGASPSSVVLKLEVDKLRYHSGQADEIQIKAQGSQKTVALGETAYLGEVTDIAPISSFGEQDVVISGRALERVSASPMPNTRLKLVLNQQGFERSYQVLTDAQGVFRHTFKPGLTDAGQFNVCAVHPDVTDRPLQKSFVINRVTVSPALSRLNMPKNYPFTLPFRASAGPGTSASHLRLVLDPVSQPTGQIPDGVSVSLAAPVQLSERQTLNIPAIFNATHEAQPSGSLIFDVMADEKTEPLGRVRVDYTLSEAIPFLVSTPGFVETGLAHGATEVESVTIKNNGLQEAINLQVRLSKADGGAAPSWVAISSQSDGTLAVGESRPVDISFSPTTAVAEGVHEFWLNITGDNFPEQTVKLYASVSQSGLGNVLFKAADIYTATVGKDGNLIQGLAGASIALQNEDVPNIALQMVTDSVGEALFQNVPTGRYTFKAKAANHQDISGRLQVKPGITLNQPLFLNYNLVTVEWNVREITIEDRYDITLSATFETDVPAAVVVMQPSSVNLPKMAAGDIYYGELSLTNHGLVRADNLLQTLPRSDAYFRFEFLNAVPQTLGAKERITLPYRAIALKSLEDAASGSNASGGGCYNYNNSTTVQYGYKCANGDDSEGNTSTHWFAFSNGTCSAPGTSTPVVIPWTPPSCSAWCGDKCCPGGAPGGGGGGGGASVLPGGPRCVNIPRNGVEYNPGTCSAP